MWNDVIINEKIMYIDLDNFKINYISDKLIADGYCTEYHKI